MSAPSIMLAALTSFLAVLVYLWADKTGRAFIKGTAKAEEE